MLSETEVARDIHSIEGPSRRTKVPVELSFEEILKNNTLPPCSLNDFMDFLVYEERNAEILQFFTWFCGYVDRWSELSSQEKSLSPPRHPDTDGGSPRRLAVQTHRRAGSDRLHQILRIMEKRNATDNTDEVLGRIHKVSGSTNFSTPRAFSDTQTSQGDNPSSAGGEAGQSSKQPFRDEITKVVQHYITENAPRRLRIPDEDLADCLDAVQTTTHPSALLPAFTAAEASLKSRCHPRFIRRSQRNANKPRLILTRISAIILVTLGFVVDQILILSSLSSFYRVLDLILWWPGFTILIAAIKGVCVFLHMRNLRQLRPWEQEDLVQHSNEKEDTSFADPLRKSSMQVFGPTNRVERRAHTKRYRDKSMVSKIWERTARTQNRAIELLQDRTVLIAVCWGGAISSVLTVVSLFIPTMNAF